MSILLHYRDKFSKSTLSSSLRVLLGMYNTNHLWYKKKNNNKPKQIRKKKQHKPPQQQQKTNTFVSFVLPFSESNTKPCQRKMQQQRALEALSCIAIPTHTHRHICIYMYTHTLLHKQNACLISSVHMMHRKLTEHFSHKLQLHDIHPSVQNSMQVHLVL